MSGEPKDLSGFDRGTPILNSFISEIKEFFFADAISGGTGIKVNSSEFVDDFWVKGVVVFIRFWNGWEHGLHLSRGELNLYRN